MKREGLGDNSISNKLKRRNKRRILTANLFVVFGLILIVTSFAYLLNSKMDEEKNRIEALKLEKLYSDQVHNKSERTVLYFRSTNKADKKEDNISFDAIGVIRIDKLGIIAQIFKSTDDYSLLKGVGITPTTDTPSSHMGSLSVIAGHRGGRNEELSFYNIDQLEYNDEIRVTTKNEILVYNVVGQEIVDADDWSKFVREDDKSKLILLTCHPYPTNEQRLLVKAELKRVD